MQYTVREVGNAREFRQFYQFQNRLFRDCPVYVPSLDSDQRHTLAHSPCLDYCLQKLLLCFDEAGRVTGRCCAIINPHPVLTYLEMALSSNLRSRFFIVKIHFFL